MASGTTILQTKTVVDSAPGWSIPLGFGQFNPSAGTLNSVSVGVVGDVAGFAAIENLGATAAGMLVDLSSTIVVTAPGGTPLAAVNPNAAQTVVLGAYDGTANFAGPSGTVVSNFANTASSDALLIPGGTIAAPFVGTGTINLTASSQASSTITGYGNLLSLTTGKTGATVSIDYGYTPAGGGSGGDDGSGFTSVLVPVLSLGFANAETTAAQTLHVADTTTGWNTSLAANQFNPALGTLEAVNITLVADINAGLAVENLGATAGLTSLTETADITLTLPGTIGAVTGAPSISTSKNLAAFDGTIDFAGLSGSDITGLTNIARTSQSTPYGADLSTFIGTGTIALPIAAYSPSTLTGPADLAAELLTDAGATVEISYTYLPAASAPANPAATLTITGTAPNQGVTGQTTVNPFANVVIADSNVGQTETVTVTQSVPTNGTLIDLGGGTYNPLTGIYTDIGSAATVTAALQALVFTPNAIAPGQTATTRFTISDTDTAGASATDNTTSVTTTAGVLINTGSVAATINAELARTAVPPVINGLATLQHAGLTGINPFANVTITDPNAIAQTETVTFGVDDGSTLSKLGGGTYDGSTYTDTGSAAEVSAALQGLVYTPSAAAIWPGQTILTSFLTINDTDTTGATSTKSNTVVSTQPADILFQNIDGQLAVWQMNGSTIHSTALFDLDSESSWFARATGGYPNNDGAYGVFQNENGAVRIETVTGTSFVSDQMLPANPGPSWHVEGSGNFYGDGKIDILWQNDNGMVALWDVGTNGILQSGFAPDPGPAWHIKGSGHFYSNSNTDILFQNDDGQVAIWDMNGTTIVQAGIIAASPGPAWAIKGTGDFYGNGDTDILFQNTNGEVAVWDMKGTTIAQYGTVGNTGPTWHIAATSDFNGDGKADIAFQNDSGMVAIWDMNGTTILTAATVANPPHLGPCWAATKICASSTVILPVRH